MIAELADGRELEFPDGTDPAVVQATVKKVLGIGAMPAAPQTKEQALKSMPTAEFWAGLPATRAAMGVASPIIAAAQMLGGEGMRGRIAELEAAKRRGMEARGEGGYDWMGLLGQALPAGAVAGAVTKALPAAAGLAGRIGTGAAVGTGIAATTPVTEGQPDDFWANKALQTSAGAVLGGTIPAAIQGAKAVGGIVGRIAEPLYENGRAAILKRYQEGLLGQDAGAKAKVIQALQGAQEIVPGSQPTAGEAIAQIPEATGLAAHQRTVSRMEGISPKFAQRSAEQEAARQAAVGSIAKTPAQLEAAIKARSVEAGQKYGVATHEMVQADPALNDLLEHPSMKHVLGRAKDLAKEKGEPFQTEAQEEAGQYSVGSLHYIKMALDDLIKNPERFSIGASEARAIGGTRAKFLEWLDTHSPAYKEARVAFAEASKPINRMQVGQELQKALTAPLGTTERAAGFATAMREAPRTLKKATGEARYGALGEALTPEETSKAEAVAKELARKDAYQRLAAKTNLAPGGVFPKDVPVQVPTLLSRPAMLANFLMRQAGESAEQKIAKLAGQQYLHPQDLATALQDLPTPRRRMIIDAIMQRAGVPLTLGAARQF